MGYYIYNIICMYVCVPSDICELAKQRVSDLLRLLLLLLYSIISRARKSQAAKYAVSGQQDQIQTISKPALEKEQHW